MQTSINYLKQTWDIDKIMLAARYFTLWLCKQLPTGPDIPFTGCKHFKTCFHCHLDAALPCATPLGNLGGLVVQGKLCLRGLPSKGSREGSMETIFAEVQLCQGRVLCPVWKGASQLVVAQLQA
jgi:hypothetical protein